jgi:hypothetical protein
MGITSAMKLETWEVEAGEAWPRARLEDICAKQGFDIFHLIMSYWAVSLLLSARCCAVLDRVSESTPALQALASLLPNEQKCAVAIATHVHRYFTPTSGPVGPQCATFPLSIAAIHHFNAIRTPGMRVGTQSGAGKKSDALVYQGRSHNVLIFCNREPAFDIIVGRLKHRWTRWYSTGINMRLND